MYTAITTNEFRLANGTLVDRSAVVQECRKVCHYVNDVVVAVTDDQHLAVIILPKRSLLNSPDYEKSPEEGCFCPRNLNELGRCLTGCMHTVNKQLLPGYAKIDAALIINADLTPDISLTTDVAAFADKVLQKYAPELDRLFEGKSSTTESIFYMRLKE